MPSRAQSVLIGGVVIGVAIAILDFVPFLGQCLACLAIVGAGVLAVWHYTSTYNLTITGGTGAGMGALAAIVAAIVDGLFGFVFAALGLTISPQEAMRRSVDQMREGGMSPEQVEAVQQFVESPLFLPSVMFCAIVIYALLGAIGGAVGASIYQKGDEGTPGQQAGQAIGS